MFSPDVDFCGYSIPHPSESKILLRIQSRSIPAVEILRQGLQTLKDVCDTLSEKFKKEIEKKDYEIDLNKEI